MLYWFMKPPPVFLRKKNRLAPAFIRKTTGPTFLDQIQPFFNLLEIRRCSFIRSSFFEMAGKASHNINLFGIFRKLVNFMFSKIFVWSL